MHTIPTTDDTDTGSDAFSSALTVGNLYYSDPILNILAKDFEVTYATVSQVPTLMQAGYATGLLFVCPLGDLFKRRSLTLVLVAFTATMWWVLMFCPLVFLLTV